VLKRTRRKDYEILRQAKPKWIKSTASAQGDSCVEVASVSGLVAVRDSQTPDRPALLYTPDEWRAFMVGAKQGQFDRLA
jgi:Domain of unknown function (DUF397)